MRSNRSYAFAIILVLFAVVTVYAARPNWPTQNSVPVSCNFGFKAVATPTITLDAADTINLADFLPAECLGFELRAASGSFIIGHPDNVASGTNRVGRLIPAGQTYSWSGLAGSFVGAIKCDADETIVVIDAAWGQYEK
jgi:hypothetical protein